jgi:hypothetical protein
MGEQERRTCSMPSRTRSIVTTLRVQPVIENSRRQQRPCRAARAQFHTVGQAAADGDQSKTLVTCST